MKIVLPEDDARSCGVVSVKNWMTAPDGESYQVFFADQWVVLTDAQISKTLPNFRSSEKWALAAVVDNEPLLLIPGCQINSWCFCKVNPKPRTIYSIVPLQGA